MHSPCQTWAPARCRLNSLLRRGVATLPFKSLASLGDFVRAPGAPEVELLSLRSLPERPGSCISFCCNCICLVLGVPRCSLPGRFFPPGVGARARCLFLSVLFVCRVSCFSVFLFWGLPCGPRPASLLESFMDWGLRYLTGRRTLQLPSPFGRAVSQESRLQVGLSSAPLPSFFGT